MSLPEIKGKKPDVTFTIAGMEFGLHEGSDSIYLTRPNSTDANRLFKAFIEPKLIERCQISNSHEYVDDDHVVYNFNQNVTLLPGGSDVNKPPPTLASIQSVLEEVKAEVPNKAALRLKLQLLDTQRRISHVEAIKGECETSTAPYLAAVHATLSKHGIAVKDELAADLKSALAAAHLKAQGWDTPG